MKNMPVIMHTNPVLSRHPSPARRRSRNGGASSTQGGSGRAPWWKLPIAAIWLLAAPAIWAQTADDYVSQGRAFLAVTNLAAANNSFSNALVLAPTHEAGNVLYAATRLLVWPNQPVGSNFLSRLGVPAAGRSIYHWTARLPRDTNGVLVAPAGVNANETTAMARTNLLAVVIAAEANLAAVTDTNFTLSLTAAETQSSAVTLDYGDLQMLRAMLQAVEYAIYNTYGWNLDVQLTAVRALYTNGQLDFERLFSEYPSLLTFATTNDLSAARTAFINGVARYVAASQFIRSRTNVTRLFNCGSSEAPAEQKFRLTLLDLQNSLNGAVTLEADPGYSVFMPSLFDGTHPIRSFLPQLHGPGFALGTLPDITFGGAISGVQPGSVEQRLAGFMIPFPDIPALVYSPNQPFGFQINCLKGRGYVVQVSTNLINWSDYTVFVSTTNVQTFTDVPAQVLPRRFYRVVERPLAQFPPPPNDNFVNRIPLTGLGIATEGYIANATTEPGEPGFQWPSVWWSWTAPANGYVVVGTVGSDAYPSISVYTGSSLTNLIPVNYAGYPGQSYNGFSFYANSGTTYQIQVAAYAPEELQLEITYPPDLIITRPFDGTVFPAPTNFTISALSVDLDGSITRMDCYGDGTWLGGTTNDTIEVVWSIADPGVHEITVSATDNLGITTSEFVTVTLRPPNDNFAHRIPIVGLPAVVTGTDQGASKEPGEPNHGGSPGGASVWWSWTAPANHVVTAAADIVSPYAYGGAMPALLGVYTGSSVSNLVLVASNTPIYGLRAEVTFNATVGVTYQIAVDAEDAEYGESGNITLSLMPTQPPLVAITSPVDGATFLTTGVTNIAIAATASDSDGTVSRVDFYTDGGYYPIGTFTNSPFSMVWSNVPRGSYTLLAKATDNAGATTFSAPVIIAVAAPGDQIWNQRYNGPGNGDDEAVAVAVDHSNNVVVTGYSTGSRGDYDYATIKYSSAGVPLWTNGPGNDDYQAYAVAVDGNNNVIVTGAYGTIEYSSAGVPLWTHYGGSALAVDRSNNVIVTGFSFVTVKYAGVPSP